ncbi:MAG: NAD-dependent epimerase/dehydratase family protein [Candidatus Dormibacter sp.]
MVTGAAGFIGSHLCEPLLEEVRSVIGVDSFSPSTSANARSTTSATLMPRRDSPCMKRDIADVNLDTAAG